MFYEDFFFIVNEVKRLMLVLGIIYVFVFLEFLLVRFCFNCRRDLYLYSIIGEFYVDFNVNWFVNLMFLRFLRIDLKYSFFFCVGLGYRFLLRII